MTAAAKPTVALRIEPIQDERLIACAMRHPRIYPHISDDACPSADQFKVVLNDSLLYLGVFEGHNFLGLFLAHPHNHVTYEVHTCLLPEAWGGHAVQAGRAVIRWLWDCTPCHRVVTSVPEGNLLALRLAKAVGMTEYGVNPRSLMRAGVLLDQTLLGVSKD